MNSGTGISRIISTLTILNKDYIRILDLCSKTNLIRENFWLTGGTALAEFYLQHRLSEDLDFFTDNKDIFRVAIEDFRSQAQKENIKLEVKKNTETFADINAILDEKIKLNFAVDAPYRFKPTIESKFGIKVENKVDLSCNKLSALFNRYEPKDFTDVYFIHKELFNLDNLIPWAKDKHEGMDNYWLSVSFLQVEKAIFFLQMIKSVDVDDLKQVFINYAQRLIKEPFEAKPYSEQNQ